MVEVPKITKLTKADKIILKKLINNNKYYTFKNTEPLAHQFQTILRCIRKPENNEMVNLLCGATSGSGKTTLGCMLCEMFLNVPGHRTAVIMKTMNANTTSGSIFTLLRSELRDFPDIKIINSSPLSITNTSNESVIEFYSANDVQQFKSRWTGKSYQLVVVDESSYIPKEALQFIFRSVRKPRGMKFPLKVVHLSNPSANVESTNYLKETYIYNENNMFIQSSYKQNHYLDDSYESILDQLDYIDVQFQKLGNWEFQISAGDLISSEDFDNCCAGLDKITPVDKILSVDVAGGGQDLSVCSTILKDKSGRYFVYSQESTRKPNCDGLVLRVAKKTEPSLIIVEGGLQSTYLINELKKDLYNSGLTCRVVEEKVHKSKYDRARTLASIMLNGQIVINKAMPTLQNLKGEMLNIVPQFKGKSPDFLDSVSIFSQYGARELFTKKGSMKFMNLQTGETIGFNLPKQPDPEDYDFSRESDCISFHNSSISRHKRCKDYALDLWREGKLKL